MISENNQQNSLSDVTYPLYKNGYSYTGINGNIRDRLPVFDDILSLKWQRSLADRNGDTRKLLPLWIADMDFETVPTVKEALQKRISTGIYGYSYIPESYKEAVADWFKNRFHHSLLSREIIPFTGVIPAINAAIYAFTRPRANVLLQTPVYHPFFKAIASTGRTLLKSPLVRKDNRYEIDFVGFENVIREQRPELFVLCNPQNPTGRVFSREELQRLTDICLRYRVFIVADEIHSDIVFKPTAFTSTLNLNNEELSRHLIVCTSTSKTFNLAGLASANIFIKDTLVRKRFLETVEKLGQQGHGPGFIQTIAAETAYRTGKYWLRETMSYIQENFAYAYKRLDEELPHVWHSEKPEGTYFLWLDFSRYGFSNRELENLLLVRCRIQANQGYIFGEEGSGFVRINIACPRSILKEALDRLVEELKTIVYKH